MTNLALRADTASLTEPNVVANLAANVTGVAPAALEFHNLASLTVGPTIDGLTGVTAVNGGIDLQATVAGTSLTVNAPVNSTGTGGLGTVSLAFDNIAINDDQSGELVQERTERTAGYCSFGGGEPDCDIWVFAEHDNQWPNGQAVADGTYTVNISITQAGSSEPSVFWNFQFEVAQS